MEKSRVIALVVLTACRSYSDDNVPSDAGSLDGSGTSSSSGASSGSGTSSDSGTSSGDVPTTDSGVALEPGEIVCTGTTTVCDARVARCCINVFGTDSAAGRTYNTSQARCGAIDGPNCGGTYGSTGDDFNMGLSQRCTTKADCADNLVCCVLPLLSDRFSKQIGSIVCIAAADCNTTGRLLCTSKSDCPATENCLAETDPVLKNVYRNFCH